MEIVFTILVFILILFLYIHIFQHYKTSSIMEIYEYEYISNKHLQEICDLKQPVLFQFSNDIFKDISMSSFLSLSENEINVKDIDDYWKTPTPTSVDSVKISLNSFLQLIQTDETKQFFTENNHEFISQLSLLEDINPYLKPDFTFSPKYDFVMGSYNTITPLKFHKDYRRFITVLNGSIKIKMLPYKYIKQLDCVMDYENMEFWSPLNTFDISNTNIQFLDFEVYSGYTLYIPPYWFYSMKFSGEQQHNILLSTTYDSPMNVLANTPDYTRNFIQKYNTYYKPTPTTSPIVKTDLL